MKRMSPAGQRCFGFSKSTGTPRAGTTVLRASTTVVVLLVLAVSGCTSTMDRGELATEYYNLGSAFFDLGDLERSADYFTRALEFDPSLARASYNLARVYVLQGRLQDAEAILTELQLLEPENTIILETLAYVAYSAGDLQAAGSYYDTVLRIDPGNLNALFNRALIAEESDDPDLAASLLTRAVEIEPRDAAILSLLAEVQEQRGNLEDAISALVDLKDIGESDPSTLLRLAALYGGVEQYDRALAELDEVIAAADDQTSLSEAQFARARILLTAAQEPEAGLEALAASFDAGFADSGRISDLRENPALTALAEVDDLIDSYGLLADPAPTDLDPATVTSPEEGQGPDGAIPEPVPVDPADQ